MTGTRLQRFKLFIWLWGPKWLWTRPCDDYSTCEEGDDWHTAHLTWLSHWCLSGASSLEDRAISHQRPPCPPSCNLYADEMDLHYLHGEAPNPCRICGDPNDHFGHAHSEAI